MNNIYKSSKKRMYIKPLIVLVVIDNEISLILNSPTDPGGEPIINQSGPTNPYNVSE